MILATVMAGLMLPGCAGKDRYSYPRIKNEFGQQILTSDAGRFDVVENDNDACVGPGIEAAFKEPMTIRNVILLSLKNNPDLKIIQSRIQRASAMTEISLAAFWPTLGFYTEYMQGDVPSSYLFKKIDQRMLPPDVNFNEPGWFENFESGVNARMNLFNGGKDYLAYQMAKKGETIADLDRLALENFLISRLIQSFYDTLAARKFMSIAQESVSAIAEQLRMAKVHFEGGGALKSDVLSLEVRLARAHEQLLASENRYKIELAVLANLMGLDPDFIGENSLKIEESFVNLSAIPESFAEGFLHALDHRPEIARIRKQLVQSRMELDSARAGYLPRLDLVMRYYVADPDMKYNQDRENWMAALMLNWDFFSGFATSASVKKAESVVKEILAADQKEIQAIHLDVKTAYLNSHEAESRYQVTDSAVESASESLRIVKNHYLGGSVPITRFLEAELDLNRARIHATVAFYDREKARAEIARAIGMWSSKALLLQ